MTRTQAVREFYSLLARLESGTKGMITLNLCHSRMPWPLRGVYFFFEEGEFRSNSGRGPRVVRIGTHALNSRSASTLWSRLSQHAGARGGGGGGNHRGSIFRLLVGEALMQRNKLVEPRTWGKKGDLSKAATKFGIPRDHVKVSELPLEQAVSKYICAMPFLFLVADDVPGPDSVRAKLERNSIALLSNYDRVAIDPASGTWLGHFSGRERVRRSGLWNNRHANETWNEAFLGDLAIAIEHTIKKAA